MALLEDEEGEAAAEALVSLAAGELCGESAPLEPDGAAEFAAAADSEEAA